jgi:regulator of sigma E protease
MILTVIAFVVAIGVLIAVHEYGHYRVAVACGVRVLRFSVGFGRPLLRWQRKGSPTEFVIGAIPLGGYVRMLDEREGPVPPELLNQAFNTQPLKKRATIVAAGPLANLLLAAALYAVVNWVGVQEPAAVLSAPPAESLAAKAGLQGGERVIGMARAADGDVATQEPVASFEALRWFVARAAIDGQAVVLQVVAPGVDGQPIPAQSVGSSSRPNRSVALGLDTINAREVDESLLRRIGLVAPHTPAVIGRVQPGGAAAQAGLREGDRVLAVQAQPVLDGSQLRQRIRASAAGVSEGADAAAEQTWTIERDGRTLSLVVQPRVVTERGERLGRIGAFVGGPPEQVTVQSGFLDGLWRGVERTAEVSALTLQMMWRMLIGEASLKNLSGPITIADYAGKSASMGLTQYLVFLALISVSLGVLNLLPLPVLDGGHLMVYSWEALSGRPVSEVWLDRLQRGGVAVLLMMMSIALFNDVTRLLG